MGLPERLVLHNKQAQRSADQPDNFVKKQSQEAKTKTKL
jgi:hypothetical protein